MGAWQEQREEWRQQSGIPEGLINRTFESFGPGWQDKALRVCRKYAQGELLYKLHPDTAGVEGTAFLLQMVLVAYEMIKEERGW